VGWYSAIPYIGAAFGMVFIGRRSDTRGERRYHSSVPALCAAALLSVSVLTDGHLATSLVLLTLATSMLWMAYTVFWAIPSEYIKGDAAAGGIALINTIGLSGGFWGPAIIGWAKAATGSLHLGVLIVAGLALCGSALLVANRLPWE
jgi:MFS family permease